MKKNKALARAYWRVCWTATLPARHKTVWGKVRMQSRAMLLKSFQSHHYWTKQSNKESHKKNKKKIFVVRFKTFYTYGPKAIDIRKIQIMIGIVQWQNISAGEQLL